MPIQVINRGAPLWGSLASSLGAGLGQGFLQGTQNANQAQALSKVLGISPQEALSYSGLDPQVLKEVLKGKRLKNEQDVYNQALNEFEAYKRGEEEPLGAYESFLREREEIPSLTEKVYPEKKMQAPNLAQMLDLITESKLQNLYQQQSPASQYEEPVETKPEVGQAIARKAERAQDERSELEKFHDYLRKKNINLTPAQRKEAEQQILAREELAEKKKKNALDETRKYREKVNDEYELARDQIQDLNDLEELNKEGKLDDAAWHNFLKESGLEISALYNPQSQQFQKQALGFLRSGRSIFGNRITNYDAGLLLQMIPTLDQSPKGRSRVISILKRFAQGKELAYKTMRDITKKAKGGILPDDLREIVNDRLEKPLDDLYKKIKKEIIAAEKELPEGPSKGKIIASALGGKAVKGVGKALEIAPYAAGGAAIGSIFPGLGTGAGAGLGALYGFLHGQNQQPPQQPPLMPSE